VNLVTDPVLNEKREVPVFTSYPWRVPLEVSRAQTTFPVTIGGPEGKPGLLQSTWKELGESESATNPSVQGTNTVLPAVAVPP
jgi:hypothetical protein